MPLTSRVMATSVYYPHLGKSPYMAVSKHLSPKKCGVVSTPTPLKTVLWVIDRLDKVHDVLGPDSYRILRTTSVSINFAPFAPSRFNQGGHNLRHDFARQDRCPPLQNQNPNSFKFSSLLLLTFPFSNSFQNASSYLLERTGSGIGTPQPNSRTSSFIWRRASMPRKASRPERPESTAWISSSSPSQPEMRVPNCDMTSS